MPAPDISTALLDLKTERMFDWDVNTCSLCRGSGW
jgi:hypothetical protein